MAQPVRLAIAGASGRMGKALVEAILADPRAMLAAALVRSGSAMQGRDIGETLGIQTGVFAADNIAAVLANVDCLIDFTTPASTLSNLAQCRERGVGMVIGTTGFDSGGKADIAGAAKDIPVVFSPNMAVGVNAVFKLLDVAARILDDGYDIEVIESHHRNKLDSPSGTALRMGEVVAQALGRELPNCAIFGREGHTGVRPVQQIGFSTIRGGDIVGDHTVLFAGTGERIEITHKSSSRVSYAKGALRAAYFMQEKSNGLFDMQDVLGLR